MVLLGPEPVRKRPSLEDMFGEISGFVSYMEDLKKTDPAAAKTYEEKLKELSERLLSLAQG